MNALTPAGRLDLWYAQSEPFTPYTIPIGLKYFECDFERSPQITFDGSNITTFTGPYNTHPQFTQATADNKPLWQPLTFNNRPCATFDGTDSLRNTTAVATLGFPTGGAFEIWALVENTGPQLGSGVTATIFQYPTNAVNTGVQLSISGGSGATMKAFFRVGQGASSVSVVNDVSLLTGRHIIRAVSDGATIRVDVDGIAGTPSACVASGWTGGPRHTIGGNSAATAGSLFTGNMNFLGFYRPLPSFYARGLYEALNRRLAPTQATDFPYPDAALISDFDWTTVSLIDGVSIGNFYSGSLGHITVDQAVTCVRSTANDLAEDDDGLLHDFAIDEVRRTKGMGRWADTSATCRVDFNGDLTNAAWVTDNCTIEQDLPSPFAPDSTYADVPGCRIVVTADGDAECSQDLPVFSGGDESLPSGRFYLSTDHPLDPATIVEITQDGILYTDVTAKLVTNRWKRIPGTPQAVTGDPQKLAVRLRNAKAGDSIGFMLGNTSRGYVMSGDLYTSGTATKNRSTDVVTQNLANFPAIDTMAGFTIITVTVPIKDPLPDQLDTAHPRNGWTAWEYNNEYNIEATGVGQLTPFGGAHPDSSLMTITSLTSGEFRVGDRIVVGSGVGSRTDIMEQILPLDPGEAEGGVGRYRVISDIYPDGQTTPVGIDIESRDKNAQGLALNAAQKPLDPDRPGISRVGLTVTAEPDMQDFGNDPQHEDVQENGINVEVVAYDGLTRKFSIVLNGDLEESNDGQFTHAPVFDSSAVMNWGSQYPSGGPVNGYQKRDILIGRKLTNEEAIAVSNAFRVKYAL